MATITVLYFAGARDAAGTGEETLELPSGVSSVAALSGHLSSLHPGLAPYLDALRFAVNETFASGADSVTDGDTVALIPPVAGG